MKAFAVLAIFLLVSASIHSTSQAQGFEPNYDHSVSVKGLGEEHPRQATTYPLSTPLPIFPGDLLRAGINGDASVKFLVHKDGSVSDVTVTAASQREFAAPTKEAVARWRFYPVVDRKTRAPTTVWMRCQIVFKRDED